MGSTYGNSRFARLTSRLAEPIRQWILKGGFLRSPERAAWLNELGVRFQLMSAFARFETLETVAAEFRRSPDLEPVEVVDTGGFAGTAASQQAYADHLERMTYVLSPRGHENYSWRTYEALRFGRVPVIFDKDMMLPDEIDWHRIALIVPGDEPKLAYQMILNDYRSRSKESFLERQADAFAASRYIDGETWLPEAISKALGMAPAHLEAE